MPIAPAISEFRVEATFLRGELTSFNSRVLGGASERGRAVVGPVERARPGSVNACGRRLVSSSFEVSTIGEPSTQQKIRDSSSRRLHWLQRFMRCARKAYRY